MRFPPRFLEDLKSRVSIYDYAGGKIAWDRRKSRPGVGDHWAPCPFHGEKTASFHVLDQEGIFKCFGCGASGDLFGLCMQLEGVSFPEAVAHVAQLAGVPLPDDGPGSSKAEVDARARLYQVLEKAAAHFRARLNSSAGQPARAYLAKRNLPQEAWAQFGLGFAPEAWSGLFDTLNAAGFRKDDIYAAGLAKDGARGPIDIFRNRIMFPIHDAQGRVIAFGGRAMDPKDNAKYLNSPETELFHKGRTLYRLREARQALSRAKAAGLIVAEGYMDAIAFERAGLPAVAPLGTALTLDQLQLAWKSGPEPVMCFDGDPAGLRAGEKSLDVAIPHLSPDKTVRFALLTGGLDPDDLFQKEGPVALAKLVQTAVPAAQFLFQRELDKAPLATPEARAGLKRRLRTACARIEDPDTKANYLKDLLARADAAIRDSERPAHPPSPFNGPKARPPAHGARGRGRGFEPPARLTPELVATGGRALTSSLVQLLRIAADNPWLLERHADRIADLAIADSDLDAIRHALLDLLSAGQTVDRGSLSRHLLQSGLERAQARVLLWPPVVAPRGSRSRGFSASPETAADQADAAPKPAASEAVFGAIEAEWMAVLAHTQAKPGIEEDLDAVKADLNADDPDAFARAIALLKARREADARALPSAIAEPSAADDKDPDAPPNQDAAFLPKNR
jgi:DNA primase